MGDEDDVGTKLTLSDGTDIGSTAGGVGVDKSLSVDDSSTL